MVGLAAQDQEGMVFNSMLISPDFGKCQESHKTDRLQGGHTDPWLCTYQERNGSMLRESVRKRHLYYTFALIAPLVGSSCLRKMSNNATLEENK